MNTSLLTPFLDYSANISVKIRKEDIKIPLEGPFYA
jgi:hypothetical protein